MKKLLFFFVIIYLKVNCQTCGTDSEFSYPGSNTHWLYDNASTKNFCSPDDYDFLTINSTPNQLPNGWFLIWEDSYNNYSVLNRSFYSPSTNWEYNVIPYNANLSTCLAISDTTNIIISGGRLKLYSQYDPNPSKASTVYAWGNYARNPDNTVMKYHKDYTVATVKTWMSFPRNLKTEAYIKVCPINQNTFPAWWLYGNNGQEVDMIEMNDNYPHSGTPSSQDLIMTHHGKKYGGQGDTEEEGIHFDAGIDLTQNTQKYELIWDDWKTQWRLNDNLVHSVSLYHGISSNWNDAQRNLWYRSIPLNNWQAYDGWTDDKFAVHKYYPNGGGPMNMIFNTQLDVTSNSNYVGLDPNNVGLDKSFEMDNLKIWVRADCDAINNLSTLNLYDTNSSIETGKRIYAGTNITIQGDLTGIRGKHYVIYAATEEIGLTNGFSVDAGGNFFASITSCDFEQYNKETNPLSFINSEAYETDKIGSVIDIPTETTINNNFYGKDIKIETSDYAFNIVCRSSNIYKIEMLDSKGSLVLIVNNPGTNKVLINKENYSSGIYTLKINSSSGIDIRKIWLVK